ncbi:MAG: sugar phosphate nucleotidyltransferase [Chloroflexota bacterium]
MKAVILVGGEGMRLRPLTYNVPKPMLPVLNRPFLEHTLAYLRPHIDAAVLAVGYMPEAVQSYFGVGEWTGIRLDYSVEEQPLGTAGAVKKAQDLLHDTFLVLNGDIFTDLDLDKMLAFHRRNEAAATIALMWVDDPSAFGVVNTGPTGRVDRFTEKPRAREARSHWINAGIYILEPEVLHHVPPDTHYMFEKGLFPQLLELGEPVYGYRYRGYWLDMGTPAKYLQLNCDLLQGRAQSLVLGEMWSDTIDFGEGVEKDPSADVEGPAVVAEGCKLGPDSRITGPVVLGPGCDIAAGATVEDSVLWDGVSVARGAYVKRSVLGTGCKVREGEHLIDAVITQG